jgi:ribosome biogenesis GTPase / thiamine phosphate phosphatase
MLESERDALASLGWTERWRVLWSAFVADGASPTASAERDGQLAPARVMREDRSGYLVQSDRGTTLASVSGRLRHAAADARDLPVVGDFVVARWQPEGGARIEHVFERATLIVRAAAGRKLEPQPIAANVDQLWLLLGLDRDFNLRRLERYVTLAWNTGARPLVVLNKRDLCSDVPVRIAEAQEVASGAEVVAINANAADDVQTLAERLIAGQTLALLGSSGVGKSTLINQLLGRVERRVGGLRERDGRGRHTTTARELLLTRSGALLLDTPGMRELRLWDADASLESSFADVEQLALACRFPDCSHGREPGCAVRAAIVSGELGSERLHNYDKLRRESEYERSLVDPGERAARKAKWKGIRIAQRRYYKSR